MSNLAGNIQVPMAQSMLEAGDADSRRLLSAIARRLAELSPGQVLEVISAAGNAPIDAVAWCHVTGHELLAMTTHAEGARFWIRKSPD